MAIVPSSATAHPLDRWLLDRRSRAHFLRAAALLALARTLVASDLSSSEALGVLGSELGRTKSIDASRDVVRMRRWIARELSRARSQEVAFSSLALLVGEGDPYGVELALARTRSADEDWGRGITFRSRGRLELDAVGRWLRSVGPRFARDAAYVLPLAYVALVARDALADAVVDPRVRSIRFAYTDGDDIVVRWPRRSHR